MKVIILAGGLGTRLSPVIKDLPKPMAPVGDKCFLEILLGVLKKNGLLDITLCVCHLADKIRDYFGDGSRVGVRVGYSIEEMPLGTGGAIGLLRNVLKETFCVLNGDTYQELDIQRCIARHMESGAVATMSVAKVRDSSRYGQVIIDPDGYLTGFCEKGAGEQASLINTGLYILEPIVFEYIPEDKVVSLERDVLPALIKDDKKVGTYQEVNNFFDIGIPEDYYNFRLWFIEQSTGKGNGLD